MKYFEAVRNRRTYYNISKESFLKDNEIENLLRDAVKYTPSAFNSQSSRVVLLLKENHNKFWSIVMETLRNIVPADKFSATEAKINSFALGYGTVLFYEDQEIIKGLQEQFPIYAENFDIWSNHSTGMLQYVVWTGLESSGLGASLQHYNPIIDDEVRKQFNLPESWKLIAQMPFGNPTSKPDPAEYIDLEKRIKVFNNVVL